MISRVALKVVLPTASHRVNTISGLLRGFNYSQKICKRRFLSEAYYCNEDWEKRFNSDLLAKFKLDNFYYDLDRKLTTKKPISAVDIDIFANMTVRDDDLDTLEDIIHRFRRTPQTVHTFPSTHHAVIRVFLKCGNSEGLMRILNDRLNYGIFADHFTYNIMMDTFLKQKNYRDAAKAATFLMLVSDFRHPLTNILALYSCHMHLQNPSNLPWDSEEEETKEDDDEEVVWQRVRFIHQPFFDEHFDLRDPKHLVGKTLHWVGREVGGSLGQSYHLMGLALYEKWDLLKDCLEEHVKAKENLQILKKCVDKIVQLTSEIADEEKKTKISTEIDNLIKQIKIVDEDPDKLFLDAIKTEVSRHEQNDIKRMKENYVHWSEKREEAVKKDIEEFVKQERLKKIEEKVDELKKREQLLFFFENIEKHRMNIPPEEEDQMINEEGKVSGRSLLDVPPEIEGKDGRFSAGIIEEHEPWWRWKENKEKSKKESKS